MSSTEVFIVSAARTPIGSFSGTISKLKASELGTVVIKEVLRRSNVDAHDVNEVIMGQTLIAGQGQNPARQASLEAGIPIETPAYGVNMLCGSGIKTVVLGYQSIRCGDASIIISGGQENMSLTPHVICLREPAKLGTAKMLDHLIHDCLTDAMYNIHMGVTAENIATKYNISREEQDKNAEKSQNLAETAQNNGYFSEEIVPVHIVGRNGTTVFDKDEYIKHGTKLEKLQKLKPCFIENGTVTPGNASGVNDAASAVLLMSGEEVRKRSAKPLAKIIAWAQSGCDPKIMGMGPVKSVEAVLQKAGWSKEEVDLYELNEAFSAQALACVNCLNLDPKKVNVSGGAIALGHPIGASGNRILVTLIYALKRTGGSKGVASLCIGGGMGIAIAIQIV